MITSRSCWNERRGGTGPAVKRSPKATYRSDPDGGPDANNRKAWGDRPAIKRSPKATYRSDPDGGPDANKMKPVLIFDLDGTLVDSKRDLTASVNYIRHKFD